MGWRLRKSPGWGNLLHRLVALGGWRAQRGDCAAAWLLEVCPALASFPVTSPTPHIDPRPSGYCPGVESQSGWVCTRVKIMWTLLSEPQYPAVSLTAPLPLLSTARSYGDLSSWCWNPGLYGLAGLGPGLLTTNVSLLSLSTTHECEATHACSTATVSPHHLDVSSCVPGVGYPSQEWGAGVVGCTCSS